MLSSTYSHDLDVGFISCNKLMIGSVFLPRDALQRAVYGTVILSVVCLFACLSVYHTRGLCRNG